MVKTFGLLLTFFVVNFVTAQEVYETAYWSAGSRISRKLVKGAVTLEFYNTHHLLIEKRNANNTDSIYTKERTVFEYNDKQQKVTETDYTMLNTIRVQRHYEYDENGLLKKMWYSHRGKKYDSLETKEIYAYDGTGNLIKKVRVYGIPIYLTTQTSVFEYEEKSGMKTVTERMNTAGRKKQVKTVRVYNEHGLLASVTENKKKIRYTYEYNAAGEWVIMKICRQDGFLYPWVCDGEYRRTRIK